ncbi:MAG: hypothetical protein HZB65_04205 [Candidatus Aenigmarchaeota archaeon]|nr:hypothetical protein [Candidatus Aenigmarchaeota archaeon]
MPLSFEKYVGILRAMETGFDIEPGTLQAYFLRRVGESVQGSKKSKKITKSTDSEMEKYLKAAFAFQRKEYETSLEQTVSRRSKMFLGLYEELGISCDAATEGRIKDELELNAKTKKTIHNMSLALIESFVGYIALQ